MSENKNILALYDCRSKQEYIYRTNKVKEISGASELLAGVFRDFFYSSDNGFNIRTDWRESRPSGDYLKEFNSSGLDGEIIYEGGGNLCVIYKNREVYKKVNMALSRKALENTFAVSIIASAAEVTNSFTDDRKRLYKENALRKNLGAYHTPVNALPFVQVDRLTYHPIVCKDKREYTTESLKKKRKFESIKTVTEKNDPALYSITAYDFDDMTDKSLFRISPHTSFRQILPQPALKILAGRQPACGFLPCLQQNYARKSAYGEILNRL